MSSQMRRVLLTKRKPSTATSPASQLTPSSELMTTSDIDSISQYSSPAARKPDLSPLPQKVLGVTSIKREICSPEGPDRIKSEPKSRSPHNNMAPTLPECENALSRSRGLAVMATKPMGPLISDMIDSTEYAPSSARKPSVPRSTASTDEEVARQFAASIAAFTRPDTVKNEHQRPRQQSDASSAQDLAFDITPANNDGQRRAGHTNAETTSRVEGTPLRSDKLSKDTGVILDDSQEIPASPSTSAPRIRQCSSQSSDNRKLDQPKLNTSASLYPGPSATMSSSDLPGAFVANKRPKTGRSDHPERFLYSGNTFSNLNDRAFHDAAKKNPYLSQLTADASRPVYKSPVEARHALKEAAKPAVVPINYDQQIKELAATLADFRKRYAKSKLMTAQAGIEVAGNVWDRLSNMVQYPPDFDEYSQQGEGELAKYAEQMKAWDKAIGHQVIIKKRIVYKEAIEKLQVKLDILQAERDIDCHHANLKRKAGNADNNDSEEDD